MTVVAYLECDEPGCDARVDGIVAPTDWVSIVYGPDAQFGVPASKHFCSAHVGSSANLEAIRAVTARRREVEAPELPE